MTFDNMLSVTQISASGLAAERRRMEIIANNIANANTTRTPSGGPFRRQDAVFEAVYDRRLKVGMHGAAQPRGVRLADVVDDPSELNRIYSPGHPDADKDGFLLTPNVHLPMEMINLVSASRGYEANMRVLQMFRQMAESALTLGRG
jgi:flagellar basal-body rod protein FlgC